MHEPQSTAWIPKLVALLLVPAALAAGWYLFPSRTPPPSGSRGDTDHLSPRSYHGRFNASGGAVPHGQHRLGATPAASPQEVRSVAHAGDYTYVELIEDNDETTWIAAPRFDVQPGEKVEYVKSMEQEDFRSARLGRTFDRLVFASAARTVSSISTAHEAIAPGREAATSAADIPRLNPPPGGRAIAEIYADRTNLQGQEVVVRGVITKANQAILGTNWYHLRDGSGDTVSGDLTFTSQQILKLGERVTVRGTLAVDQTLAGSYKFPILLSDPRIELDAIGDAEPAAVREPVEAP